MYDYFSFSVQPVSVWGYSCPLIVKRTGECKTKNGVYAFGHTGHRKGGVILVLLHLESVWLLGILGIWT